MRIYKPTTIQKALVTQEIRKILDADLDAPGNTQRRVQLMVPGEPTVWAWIADKPSIDMAKIVGLNRGSYKGPVMTPATAITFCLLPSQTLWAAADNQTAAVTLIVEHFFGEM